MPDLLTTPLSQPAPHVLPDMPIAHTVQEATPALDFELPLGPGDGRYVDLTPLRGDEATTHLTQELLRAPPGRPAKLVFASHRGVGKTTELHRIQRQVSGRYHCVYLEANVELNARGFGMEDLLLVIAHQVSADLSQRGLTLDPGLMADVQAWFFERVRVTRAGKTFIAEAESQHELGAGIPRFLQMMLRLTALFRNESEERTEVKQVFQSYPGALLERVNQLLDAARAALGSRELLVIVDNLDRYAPGEIADLLYHDAERIRELRCSLILTPPIALLYESGRVDLDSLFTVDVMCSVRLRDRDEPYNTVSSEALALLERVLAERIDLDALIPDREARRRLILASGGSVRDLLDLTRRASISSESTITMASVERAVRQRRARMRDLISRNTGWAQALVHIARDKNVQPEEASHLVLFYRLALKFNGEYWYDLHPLVAEIPELRALLEEAGVQGTR